MGPVLVGNALWNSTENTLLHISFLGTVFTLWLSSAFILHVARLNCQHCQLIQECEYYAYVSMENVSERQSTCLITNLITLWTAMHKFEHPRQESRPSAFAGRDLQPASPEYVSRFMKNSLWRLTCVNMESWAHTDL